MDRQCDPRRWKGIFPSIIYYTEMTGPPETPLRG